MQLRRLHQENGQILVLFAFVVVVLLGLAGLVVDGGRLYLGRRWMQNGADAAALAAARTMAVSWKGGRVSASDSQIRNVASIFAQMNAPASAKPTIAVQYLDKNGRVTNSLRDASGVQVTATANLAATFASILGFRTLRPSAQASALFGPAGSGTGTAPIAVDSSLQGDKTGLQPANNGSGGSYVNMAVLDTAAFGSRQSLADAMANGIKDSVTIGGSYATSRPDGANLTQATVDALQGRIDRGAARGDSPTSFTADSPQLLILPTVGGGFPDAPNPVTINGFRAFFLESVDPSGNFIRGVFVSASLAHGTIDFGAPCDATSCVTVVKLTR